MKILKTGIQNRTLQQAVLTVLQVLILLGGSAATILSQSATESFDWNAEMVWPGLQEGQVEFFSSSEGTQGKKHVHVMHLDGFRRDLFREMLRAGQLPHLAFLLSRGRISFDASTVDKSETMKVIQSYLTSRRDTQVVGWWQFDRTDLQFQNYWMDPVGVMNFSLGLEFPLYPTVFDLLAYHQESVIAGFSLHHRSVPFDHYSRNYVAGLNAASDHTYLNQAHETMTSFIEVLERVFQQEEKLPVLSTSLLAAADEFGHLVGVVTEDRVGSASGNHLECFERREDDPTVEQMFQLLDGARSESQWLSALNAKAGLFLEVRWVRGRVQRFCISVPRLEVYSESSRSREHSLGTASWRYAQPKYVLAMMLIDLELGRLIDSLRSVRFLDEGEHRFNQEWGNGLVQYIEEGRAENSLFEHTLFLLFGDHGMVDTRHMMTPDGEELSGRHPVSINQDLIQVLNGRLGLVTAQDGTEVDRPAPGILYGIDNTQLPAALAYPHLEESWQRPAGVRTHVRDALAWSHDFFDDLQLTLKAEISQKYWWLFFLKRFLFEPRFDRETEKYRNQVVREMSRLYLKGIPDYLRAEGRYLQEFYDRQVRLVYGGGARNNAELFLPSLSEGRQGRLTWLRRPSFQQITSPRAGQRVGKESPPLLEVLEGIPAVGLMFVRKNNHLLKAEGPLPGEMEILVRDRFNNRGWITVRRDGETSQLLFGYRLDAGSELDPLGYLDPGAAEVWRNDHEWNDWCLERDAYYHNVVAGMGAYLYSTNPSIGDVTLMHSQGWNFGSNTAGHGGLHLEEKLTVLVASGPQISQGVLKSVSSYSTVQGPQGDIRIVQRPGITHPTLLDVIPTALAWLGYGNGALSHFARNGFEAHLGQWTRRQKSEILAQFGNFGEIQAALAEAGLEGLDVERFRNRLRRLLQFVPEGLPNLPDYRDYREDGNVLLLAPDP
ncbi:MAG: hypothetical protein V3R94_00990 [Acidobacteriota bacterium]